MAESKIAALEMMAAELTSKIAELTSRKLDTNSYPGPSLAGSPGGSYNNAYCNGGVTGVNFDYYLESCDYGLGGGSSGDTGFMILCSAIVLSKLSMHCLLNV